MERHYDKNESMITGFPHLITTPKPPPLQGAEYIANKIGTKYRVVARERGEGGKKFYHVERSGMTREQVEANFPGVEFV